jgi:hypothetical protein
MESKKLLGQFYTTNSEYILQNLSIPENQDIIEPFVGKGDLVNWIEKNLSFNSIQTFDLDPKIKCDEIRNTLELPPNYEGKFVITNPPYLAKNKNKDKTLYQKYSVDDLYKAFLVSIVEKNCKGGIVIIPLNFFSSENDEVRLKFLSKYEIGVVNVFEEKVFDDTSYTICSFNFFLKEKIASQNVRFIMHPSKKEMIFNLSEKYGFRIGGEILNSKHKIKFGRLLKGQEPSTNLFLYAVDSGAPDGRIRLEVSQEPFFGKETDRVFCTITSKEKLKNEQEICEIFNSQLEVLREEFNSLFLTNYRESTKHYSRKRISFKQAFCLLSQIVENNSEKFLEKKINNFVVQN